MYPVSDDKRVAILLEARLVLDYIVRGRILAARLWIAIFLLLWIAWLWFTRDTYSTLENLTRILVTLPIFVAHWHLRKLKETLETLHPRQQRYDDSDEARIDIQSREEGYFGEKNYHE